MSDIYDYAYMHVMRHQVEVNKYTSAPIDDSSAENLVNTEDFTPRDLQLFMDSLETITRLEKAKYERRQRRKIQSHQESFEYSKKIITCLDSSLVGSSLADEDDKSTYTSESDYIYDETYFGLSSQGTSNATYSNLTVDSLKSFSSDSEESGVFLNNTQDDHLYENIDPIRPRSKVISHPKCKSLKSRLISLIMKKQYVQPETPAVDLLSSTTYGEDSEEAEIYDRVLDDVIQHQFTKNPKKGKRKYRSSSKKTIRNC
ncbi:uncharacterized protein LOC119609379 [Lucilia sericata]|uniref:uncharacterized protein LOC119609379 n=1 Tax=Lucilia sericata TaxID=13632 RepID=UPI0018A861A1|nr:uncharacterized protein LOC119609379 [Lucilia sericata]